MDTQQSRGPMSGPNRQRFKFAWCCDGIFNLCCVLCKIESYTMRHEVCKQTTANHDRYACNDGKELLCALHIWNNKKRKMDFCDLLCFVFHWTVRMSGAVARFQRKNSIDPLSIQRGGTDSNKVQVRQDISVKIDIDGLLIMWIWRVAPATVGRTESRIQQ